jgi:hypothetical protein
MIAAEERELFTATNEKDFGVARVGLVTQEDDGSSVFWGCGCHFSRNKSAADLRE